MSLPAPSGLSSLELMGALSARLAHALSNQLAIVLGNLCVASAALDDRAKLASALKASLKTANEAGSFLEQFVTLRRGMTSCAEFTPVVDLDGKLQAWTESRPGWRFELTIAPPNSLRIPWTWLHFVLDAISSQYSLPGVLLISYDPKPSREPRTYGLNLATFQLASCATASIDWDGARRDLSNLPLAAAWELLSQIGTAPLSVTDANGLLTTFKVPLSN